MALTCAVLLLAACASGGGLLSRPQAAAGGAEPWDIAADAYPSQRLYRVKYQGPEQRASFKLTLYLAGDARFRMIAADSLGRKLWSLQVEDSGQATWLDHRRKQFCRAESAGRLTLVPLADLPLVALPKLLLGRLPASPAASLERTEGHLTYLDARGQRWNGSLRDGSLDWWSLTETGEAVAWWRRGDDGGGQFVDRRGRQELSWEEIVREQLRQPVEGLSIPASFSEGACGAATRG